MFLRYGSFVHPIGECQVAISKEGVFNESGIRRAIRERWTIRGRLQPSALTQAAVSSAILQLEDAYAVQGQDIGFYFDDGTPSSHIIQSANTVGGVRVVEPPAFPEGKGAEYSTFRNYQIVVEAEVLDLTFQILAWDEVLTFSGGGPRIVWLETRNGPPQPQIVSQQTTFRATQVGRALGNTGFPLPAGPLFPGVLLPNSVQTSLGVPARRGGSGGFTYTEFPVTWSYAFESDSPLFGAPTSWPGT